MSVEAMAIALHHSRAKGTARLVLVGIANHDGDGGAWPSMATLARYAGVDTRNAQRAVRKLEELREIRTHTNAGGLNRTPEHERPNLYEFLLTCPPSCDGSRQHRARGAVVPTQLPTFDPPSSEGVALAPGGGAGAAGGGGAGVTRTTQVTIPTQTEQISRPGNRARESAPAERVPLRDIVGPALCTTTGREHRMNRRLGGCADCDARLA